MFEPRLQASSSGLIFFVGPHLEASRIAYLLFRPAARRPAWCWTRPRARRASQSGPILGRHVAKECLMRWRGCVMTRSECAAYDSPASRRVALSCAADVYQERTFVAGWECFARQVSTSHLAAGWTNVRQAAAGTQRLARFVSFRQRSVRSGALRLNTCIVLVLHGAVLCCTVLYCTIHCRTAPYRSAAHRSVRHPLRLSITVLYKDYCTSTAARYSQCSTI
jgi:hypothetical protein